jgi:hypothetical protein
MYAGDMLCPLFNSRFVPKTAGAKGLVRQPPPPRARSILFRRHELTILLLAKRRLVEQSRNTNAMRLDAWRQRRARAYT